MGKIATEQFIDDAVAGGWRKYDPMQNDYFSMVGFLAFLDPELWEAVGDTRGWNTQIYKKLIGTTSSSFKTRTIKVSRKTSRKNSWVGYWHTFIDHLADGKTIEEALQAITNQDNTTL